MKRPPPPRVQVSDHALVRWLERVYGVEMEHFRAKLAAHVQAASETGATQWRDPHGNTYCFRDHVLVSVFSVGMKRTLNGVEQNEIKRQEMRR